MRVGLPVRARNGIETFQDRCVRYNAVWRRLCRAAHRASRQGHVQRGYIAFFNFHQARAQGSLACALRCQGCSVPRNLLVQLLPH